MQGAGCREQGAGRLSLESIPHIIVKSVQLSVSSPCSGLPAPPPTSRFRLKSVAFSYGCLSEAVMEGELERTETNKGAIDLTVTRELVLAVEGIQETVAQLYRWVEVIGQKLGVNLTDVSKRSG